MLERLVRGGTLLRGREGQGFEGCRRVLLLRHLLLSDLVSIVLRSLLPGPTIRHGLGWGEVRLHVDGILFREFVEVDG